MDKLVTAPIILSVAGGIIEIDGTKAEVFLVAGAIADQEITLKVKPGQHCYLLWAQDAVGGWSLDWSGIGQEPFFMGASVGFQPNVGIGQTTMYHFAGISSGEVFVGRILV